MVGLGAPSGQDISILAMMYSFHEDHRGRVYNMLIKVPCYY